MEEDKQSLVLYERSICQADGGAPSPFAPCRLRVRCTQCVGGGLPCVLALTRRSGGAYQPRVGALGRFVRSRLCLKQGCNIVTVITVALAAAVGVSFFFPAICELVMQYLFETPDQMYVGCVKFDLTVL